MPRRFHGRSVVKGIARGEVLFSSHKISFLGGVDPESGIVVDPSIDIFGACIADKILVFGGGKGSTVGSYVIYQLKLHRKHPRAMIVRRADAIVAAGAIIAEIPMIELDLNAKSGDKAFVNATEGYVNVDCDDLQLRR